MAFENSKRVQRVQRELFESLSHFLQHNLSLPLPCYASITAVDCAPDLRTARVFIRLVGGAEDVKVAEAVLKGERSHFQKFVARSLELKFTPVLRFDFGVAPQLDDIDILFENLKKPKSERTPIGDE